MIKALANRNLVLAAVVTVIAAAAFACVWFLVPAGDGSALPGPARMITVVRDRDGERFLLRPPVECPPTRIFCEPDDQSVGARRQWREDRP
jgi:hypothetical protein